MTRTKANRIAWSIVAIVIIKNVVVITMWASQLTGYPSLYDTVEVMGWNTTGPLVFSIIGAIIINKQPGNRVGWLMLLIGLGTVNPVSLYLVNMVQPQSPLTPGLWLLLWLDNWAWIPAIFPIFLIPLHFPTGRPPSSRWNWINYLAVAQWLAFTALIGFDETIGPFNGTWKVPNPIGLFSLDSIWNLVFIFWGIGLITIVLGSVVSLLVRYRQAQSVERQQIKWLLYAAALFGLYYAATFFISDAVGYNGWLNLLFILLILAMPIAVAVAILRYRLYDIDIIIRRTLVYTILTAALGLVYFGSVVLLQTAVGRAAGEQSPLVIVFSTLLIAALFSPLRRRIQAFIDRRFYRRKYDAAQTLSYFARTVRDEVDIDSLTEILLQVVQDTIQPFQSSVWLKPEAKVKK